MVDKFKGYTDQPHHPARDFFTVTKHDTNVLTHIPKGIVASTGGTLNMVGENGTEVQVTLIANVVYPYSPQIIKTGGTADGIVALV